MPLSSTDISNLIAGQQASFANSAVFAQGIGSGGQASAISAAPVQDPRAPSPGLAGAVGSAPDMAMGGVRNDVCRFKAINIAKKYGFTPKVSNMGKNIGTKMIKISDHSRGQPRMKIIN